VTMDGEVAMVRVAAAAFKARCLELMDEVARTKEGIVVTKYGRPVAKLVPLDEDMPPRPLFGRASGTVVHVDDDLFAPESDVWESLDD
jgi:prevent-host-death family protein